MIHKIFDFTPWTYDDGAIMTIWKIAAYPWILAAQLGSYIHLKYFAGDWLNPGNPFNAREWMLITIGMVVWALAPFIIRFYLLLGKCIKRSILGD